MTGHTPGRFRNAPQILQRRATPFEPLILRAGGLGAVGPAHGAISLSSILCASPVTIVHSRTPSHNYAGYRADAEDQPWSVS